MSGHSKWSTIKRQKGAQDIKRGATFTKISNSITLAIKQGGGIADPSSNFRLRLAMDAAKNANMPKETIERAISRASGRGADLLQEVVYEGFGPGGIAVIVEAATDNTNRTSGEIKGIFNKAGASFGQPGSVSYLFQGYGLITVKKDRQLDEIFTIAADSGADDVEEGESDEVFIYTNPSNLSSLKQKLENSGISVISAEITRKAMSNVTVGEESAQKVIDFLSGLDDLEDVQKVYSNASF